MRSQVNRLLAALRLARADDLSIAQEVMTGNLQRMVWMIPFIVPFNLLCVAIFWWFMAEGVAQELVWKTAVGWAHLVNPCCFPARWHWSTSW